MRQDLNLQPATLEIAALPIELRRHERSPAELESYKAGLLHLKGWVPLFNF